MRQLEKMILLTTIDHLWKDHLLAMDHLREGVGLQGYGQKDPLVEYKKQGYGFFEMMMNQITGDAVRKLYVVQLAQQPAPGSNALPKFLRRSGRRLEEQDAFAHEEKMQCNSPLTVSLFQHTQRRLLRRHSKPAQQRSHNKVARPQQAARNHLGSTSRR